MLQLNINIAFVRARMEIAAAFINLYVSLTVRQVAERFKILHPQCSVHRVDAASGGCDVAHARCIRPRLHAFIRGDTVLKWKAVGLEFTVIRRIRDEHQRLRIPVECRWS